MIKIGQGCRYHKIWYKVSIFFFLGQLYCAWKIVAKNREILLTSEAIPPEKGGGKAVCIQIGVLTGLRSYQVKYLQRAN